MHTWKHSAFAEFDTWDLTRHGCWATHGVSSTATSSLLSGGAATTDFVFFQFSPDPEVTGIQIVDSFQFFLQISLEQHKHWQVNFLPDRRHFFHFLVSLRLFQGRYEKARRSECLLHVSGSQNLRLPWWGSGLCSSWHGYRFCRSSS